MAKKTPASNNTKRIIGNVRAARRRRDAIRTNTVTDGTCVVFADVSWTV